MQTKIQKWGNSLAIRIPKSFALDINLKQDELVNLSVEESKIIITPIGGKKYSLEELLKGVSKKEGELVEIARKKPPII